MGRNFLFVILCIGIVIFGIDAFKPIEVKEAAKITKQKVKIEKPVVQDEEELDEVVSSQKPVLIYFYTTWCGGCKRFSPYWDVLVNKYSDKFTCIKINVDDAKYKKLAREFNIRGIPQVYIYDRVRKKKISLRVSTYMSPEIDKYYEKYYQK